MAISAGASMISFFIPGLPRSTQTGSVVQPSSRRSRRGRVLTIPLRRNPAWSRACRLVALQHRPETPLTGPLLMLLMFRFPRPKRGTPEPYPMRADLDNLAKGPKDAWQGVLYENDRQIVTQETGQRWADSRGPGLAVTILSAWR